MKLKPLVLLAVIVIAVPILVWAGASHTTAGYTSARTYLNSEVGLLRPPLDSTRSIDLPGVGSAESFIVFNHEGSQKILVGENDGDTAIYTCVDAGTETMDWQSMIHGDPDGGLDYVPAYAHGIVILGGPSTTTVRAVEVSSGATLWEDQSVGSTRGRFPVNTAGVAIYAGESAVVAVDPLDGPSDLASAGLGLSSFPSTAAFGTIWRLATTTAQAPLSMFNERLYYMDQAGQLNALSTRDGSMVWAMPVEIPNSPNQSIIATEELVFVNSNQNGAVGAVDAETGEAVWGQIPGRLSETPAMALAYDMLYLFVSPDNGGAIVPGGGGGAVQGRVVALHAADGTIAWNEGDPNGGIDYGLVANNLVWYYNQGMGQIRVRDAFTGALVDSIPREGVRGLSASEGELFILYEDSVEVLSNAYRTYFSQIADGSGQSTLLTLNNLTDETIQGSVHFFTSAGDPVALPVTGDMLSEVPVQIAPLATVSVRTEGLSDPLVVGYAVFVADGPVSGSSIYTFSDEGGAIIAEAGVASSGPTASANAYVEIFPAAGAASTLAGLAESLDTAVAVVNISGVESVINYQLLDALGDEVDAAQEVMAAGEHAAKFVDDIFPETGAGFTGTLVVSSDLPFTAAAIRTLGGVQLSSYSVGK